MARNNMPGHVDWAPIADEVMRATEDQIARMGIRGAIPSVAKAFESYGVNERKLHLWLLSQSGWRERKSAAEHAYHSGTPLHREPFTDVGKVIEAPLDGRIRTLEQLLDFHAIDLEEWEVERTVVNAYEQGAKLPDGTIAVTPLHQIKAWLRRRTAGKLLKELAADLLRDVKAKQQAPKLVRYTAPDDVLFELATVDMHLNKLAWANETGHEHYDSDVAAHRWCEANTRLLMRAAADRPSRIALILGNDFFNVAGQNNATVKGTPQDVDSRLGKMFRLGRRLVCQTIDQALQLAPVECLFVKGNHDGDLVWLLGEVVSAWYDAHPHVTIQNEPTMRKYLRWGTCLLGFTHGDKEKPEGLPLIMATERREDWAETTHREWHTGHLHKAMKWEDEYGGVRVRRLPSLCSPDAWLTEKGYVGAMKAAEGYLWSKADGYLGHLSHTVKAKAA